jgi:hypothetical protein
MNIKLLPCPFCGRPAQDDLSDSLYPSGIYWREGSWGRSYFSQRESKPEDHACFQMNCTVCEGGCGANITANSEEEVIAAWNRRATIIDIPTTDPVSVLLLHKDKL